MKVLQLIVLLFGLTVFVSSQTSDKSFLSGSVYDANGALIVGAKVTATNEKGEKFETITNDEGIYVLNLPFNLYISNTDFKIAKYDITIEHKHFEKFVLKGFKFVPSYRGNLYLDLALDVAENTNCGAGGCIQSENQPIELSDLKVSNIILQRPLKEVPKEHNKTKKIFGKVLAPDKAGIPKAKITVFNKQFKFIETFTDLNGNYELFLPVGQYRLEVYADGFIKSVIKNFSASDNKKFNLDLKLKIGVVTEHPPITENKK